MMRKKVLLILVLFCIGRLANANGNDDYITSVTFPANFAVGDYIEFLKVHPLDAGASGYYEVSISYTRGDIAAAATHLAGISHYNPNLWRETGRINNNGYVSSANFNFTVDCNTEYTNPRFRIRAVNNLGVQEHPITVNIKVKAINLNNGWTALNITGNDQSVNKFLPMTDEWGLYVGRLSGTDGANIAIKALENGNVGIGTATPQEKLSVNGKIRAKEIKVETANWPDYVFEDNYQLPDLKETEHFIKTNKHLPGIPPAKEVEENGVSLGEMNAKLLKKIEELTLYLIEKDRRLERLERRIEQLEIK